MTEERFLRKVDKDFILAMFEEKHKELTLK